MRHAARDSNKEALSASSGDGATRGWPAVRAASPVSQTKSELAVVAPTTTACSTIPMTCRQWTWVVLAGLITSGLVANFRLLGQIGKQLGESSIAAQMAASGIPEELDRTKEAKMKLKAEIKEKQRKKRVEKVNEYLSSQASQAFAVSQRVTCFVYEIDTVGDFHLIRNSSHGRFRFPTVFEIFQDRVQTAVKRFGPIPQPHVFDISTIDLPNCDSLHLLENKKLTHVRQCKEVAKKCCLRNRPLYGISRNICCPCSIPLPLHPNQNRTSLKQMLAFEDTIPWEEKLSLAVWRGTDTGKDNHVQFYAQHFNGTNSSRAWTWNNLTTPRRKVVELSQEYPTILSASFNKTKWSNVLRHKYIVSVSGHSYAGLLKPALYSKSCVLRQDAIATEWYEDWLVPWVHYVPVRYDLSDLIEKIKWAMEHDEECRKIGESGKEFAATHFSAEAVDRFIHDTISKPATGYPPVDELLAFYAGPVSKNSTTVVTKPKTNANRDDGRRRKANTNYSDDSSQRLLRRHGPKRQIFGETMGRDKRISHITVKKTTTTTTTCKTQDERSRQGMNLSQDLDLGSHTGKTSAFGAVHLVQEFHCPSEATRGNFWIRFLFDCILPDGDPQALLVWLDSLGLLPPPPPTKPSEKGRVQST